MRQLICLALIASAAPALADARGTSVYQAHCARCHVVGQGAPLRDTSKSFVDITLAARQHDEKWLMAFLQKPTSVSPDTACRTRLDDKDAVDVYRFLKKRLKAPPPEALNASTAGGARIPLTTGKVAPAPEWQTAAPTPVRRAPKGMVHR